MKRFLVSLMVSLLFPVMAAFGQDPNSASPSDPNKATIDRLDSLTHRDEAEWRFHEVLPGLQRTMRPDSNGGTAAKKALVFFCRGYGAPGAQKEMTSFFGFGGFDRLRP